MIVSEDLAAILASVRNAVVGVLLPELESPKGRGEAQAILLVLDRVLTDIRNSEPVGHAHLPAWQALHAEIARPSDTNGCATRNTGGVLNGIDMLRGELGDIQSALASTGFLSTGLAQHDAAAVTWFARTVAALSDLFETTEPIASESAATTVGDPAPDASRLRIALNAYLVRKFQGLVAEPILSLRLIPGGLVKQTAVVELRPNPHLPTHLVLRKDLAHSLTGTSIADECPFLCEAFDAGVAVPRPILLEVDASILGGGFMLMTEIEQTTSAGTYYAEDRRREPSRTGPEFGKEVAAALARLHSGTRRAAASMPDYGKLVRETQASWQTMTKPPFSLTTDLSLAWLASHPLPPDRPCCLVHADFGTHNLLVRNGHLAAIVDWELAHVGDPSEDLAQCRLMLLPDIMAWEDFAAAYVAAGGDPLACDSRAVAYHATLLFAKHAVFYASLRKTYLDGERSDMGSASLVSHYLHRLTQYQSRALKMAIEATT